MSKQAFYYSQDHLRNTKVRALAFNIGIGMGVGVLWFLLLWMEEGESGKAAMVGGCLAFTVNFLVVGLLWLLIVFRELPKRMAEWYVSLDDAGLTHSGPHGLRRVEWSDVRNIRVCRTPSGRIRRIDVATTKGSPVRIMGLDRMEELERGLVAKYGTEGVSQEPSPYPTLYFERPLVFGAFAFLVVLAAGAVGIIVTHLGSGGVTDSSWTDPGLQGILWLPVGLFVLRGVTALAGYPVVGWYPSTIYERFSTDRRQWAVIDFGLAVLLWIVQSLLLAALRG